MVDTIGFTDAVSGSPAYSGRMLRQTNGVAFAGATSARPLGARSGVRPGTPSTTVTATSTTWTCQPFAGLLDGQTAAEAGPYTFAFDAVATGSVTAANASNPRIDIVYVDVDDPSEDASAVPAATRKYLAGTAAPTPAAPATPAGCMVIAQINVPKVGAGSPTVTWIAPYLAAAGGDVPFNTKVEMDAVVTLPRGAFGVVLADLSEWVFDGTAWVKVWAPLVVGSLGPDGNATATTVVLTRDVNGMVDVAAQTTRTGGTSYLGQLILGVLPVGFRPAQDTLITSVLTYGSGSLNSAIISSATGVITLTAAAPSSGHTVARFHARFKAA